MPIPDQVSAAFDNSVALAFDGEGGGFAVKTRGGRSRQTGAFKRTQAWVSVPDRMRGVQRDSYGPATVQYRLAFVSENCTLSW